MIEKYDAAHIQTLVDAAANQRHAAVKIQKPGSDEGSQSRPSLLTRNGRVNPIEPAL
jgi:hypothetical protein